MFNRESNSLSKTQINFASPTVRFSLMSPQQNLITDESLGAAPVVLRLTPIKETEDQFSPIVPRR